MSSPRWRILLVAEGPSDWRRLRFLVDHSIQQHGITDLAAFRRFEPFQGHQYIRIREIPALVRELGLDRRYSAAGPNKRDAGTLRKLHQVLRAKKLLGSDLVVIWARDDDGDPARREDAVAARESLRTSTPATALLLAVASECGEAWVVAGWRPVTKDDEKTLQELRKELGFDPCANPQRLSHKDDAPKSAKQVVERLGAGDPAREETSLVAAMATSTSIGCGLRAFCEEVADWLSAATV